MRHISVFVLWSVIKEGAFPQKSHHRCNIPLHMQEQDNSDKLKKVRQLFGYILLQNLFELYIANTTLLPQNNFQ